MSAPPERCDGGVDHLSADLLHGYGGVVRRADLLAAGVSDARIRVAVRDGSLVRARRGWYVTPDAPPEAREAIARGGRLAGRSALRSYGVWMPSAHALEMRVPANAGRLRVEQTAGAVVHWSGDLRRPGSGAEDAWRDGPLEALSVVLRGCGREEAIVLADSIIHLGLASETAVLSTFADGPRRARAWAALVDGRAEAGGETIARLRLQDAGIRAIPQFRLPGVGPYDLRCGASCLMEIDGRAHHDDPPAFERDRAKDLVARLWGYEVVRISYRQLRDDWPACLQAVRAWSAR